MKAWLGVVVIAGCAHAIDPGVRATVPAPPAVAGADFGSETFAGAGGVQLYGRWWRPAGLTGPARAVLVVQHGLNDHGDRYAHLAQALVADGIAVYAMDLRGHGRSAGPRVEVDHFHDYLDDEAAWISRVRDKEKGAPIFVFGHSMGGLIMTIYAEEHPGDVAGVVLSAPALGIDAPPIQVAGIQLIAHLGSPGSMLPQRDAQFSRDPAVVAAMGADPLLTHADGPTHTAVELVEATRVAWAGAATLIAPILILHGSADKLTSPAATRDFIAHVAALGSKDARHVVIPGAWHDLTHDPETPFVEKEIDMFIDAHAPGGAPRPNVLDEQPPVRHQQLDGEHRPSAMAVELGGVIGASSGAASSGELATRYSYGGRALAWHGELDVRVRDGVGLDVLPVGVATRLGRAGELAIAGGIAIGWPRAWSAGVSIPARVSFELPAGPLHLFGRVAVTWVSNGPTPIDALFAIRLGGDRDYWSQLSAGSGPFAGVTYSRVAGVDVWGVALGIHLWGVD